jgi:hypothetical protein
MLRLTVPEAQGCRSRPQEKLKVSIFQSVGTVDLAVPSAKPHTGHAAALTRLAVCGPSHADREELEAFVQNAFQRKHGASVRTFLPQLVGLRDPAGTLIGVAGYRGAASGALYLEQYLPQPIERLIAAREPGWHTQRADVAEIGNFACRDCATAMTMVAILADFLTSQGHRWVVFTGTRTVRGIMRHLGIPLAELARADKSRVVVTSDDWGEYYATDPRVMLGYVPAYCGQAVDLTWSS